MSLRWTGQGDPSTTIQEFRNLVENILQVISCVEASRFGRYVSNNEHIYLLIPMIKPCMSVLPGALPKGTSHNFLTIDNLVHERPPSCFSRREESVAADHTAIGRALTRLRKLLRLRAYLPHTVAENRLCHRTIARPLPPNHRRSTARPLSRQTVISPPPDHRQ
ncbi:hypothetical protein F2Q68_00016222 [Brassica cretica]|uniref:Uncharacterized protein n=1 Tax=Brassica cretica TaxID=69181 RepID=A0A8S9HFW8_BRACR|nr:hypothetical protein F2Q68_00016222 [Brassica cretica]